MCSRRSHSGCPRSSHPYPLGSGFLLTPHACASQYAQQAIAQQVAEQQAQAAAAAEHAQRAVYQQAAAAHAFAQAQATVQVTTHAGSAQVLGHPGGTLAGVSPQVAARALRQATLCMGAWTCGS